VRGRLVLWLELCFVPTTKDSCLVNILNAGFEDGPTKNCVSTAGFDEAENCCFSLFIAACCHILHYSLLKLSLSG
jgi:hypothetical protein